MNLNLLIILITSAFAKTGRNRYQRYIAHQRKMNSLQTAATRKNIPKNHRVENHTKFVHRKLCNVMTCSKCDIAISRGYRIAQSCKVLLTVKNCCNNNLYQHALWKLSFCSCHSHSLWNLLTFVTKIKSFITSFTYFICRPTKEWFYCKLLKG